MFLLLFRELERKEKVTSSLQERKPFLYRHSKKQVKKKQWCCCEGGKVYCLWRKLSSDTGQSHFFKTPQQILPRRNYRYIEGKRLFVPVGKKWEFLGTVKCFACHYVGVVTAGAASEPPLRERAGVVGRRWGGQEGHGGGKQKENWNVRCFTTSLAALKLLFLPCLRPLSIPDIFSGFLFTKSCYDTLGSNAAKKQQFYPSLISAFMTAAFFMSRPDSI